MLYLMVLGIFVIIAAKAGRSHMTGRLQEEKIRQTEKELEGKKVLLLRLSEERKEYENADREDLEREAEKLKKD